MKQLMKWGIITMLTASLSGCSRNIDIVAHRGASFLAPENTLAAIALAWKKNADAEVDVRLTRDNRVVVIHDDSTERTAAGGEDLKIAESSLRELKRLDVGRCKSEAFTGEKIPLIEEVLLTIPPGRKLFIEIKSGPEILPFLKKAIRDSGKEPQVLIIGFDLETMARSKELMPGIPIYLIKGTKKDKKTKAPLPHGLDLIDTAKAAGLDGLDVHFEGVTQKFLTAASQADLPVYVWTVDDPRDARRLAKLKVDGITTNRPGWLRDRIEEK